MRKFMSMLIFAALLAACGGSPAAAPSGAPTSPPAGDATSEPTAAPAPTEPPAADPTGYPAPPQDQGYPAPGTPSPDTGSSEGAVAEIQRQARERLAQHLGIDPATLTLSASEQQEWRDGSLGCPAPGVSYLQVIIPGYRLEFTGGGQSYAVHTSISAQPGEPMVYCDDGSPVDLSVAVATPTVDAAAQPVVDRAKADLAQFLGIDVGQIELVQLQPVDWNDSSLGCPQPDTTYLQVITPGYQVVLRAEELTYTYHTDQASTVVRCVTPGQP